MGALHYIENAEANAEARATFRVVSRIHLIPNLFLVLSFTDHSSAKPRVFPVSVNISPAHFVDAFVARVQVSEKPIED
jgi:hypothetical protein